MSMFFETRGVVTFVYQDVFATVWRHQWLPHPREGCLDLLVGRVQGHCWTPSDAQDSPIRQRVVATECQQCWDTQTPLHRLVGLMKLSLKGNLAQAGEHFESCPFPDAFKYTRPYPHTHTHTQRPKKATHYAQSINVTFKTNQLTPNKWTNEDLDLLI